MRYLILLLLFNSSFIAIAQSITIYQEAETGKYYRSNQLEEANESKVKTYKMVFPNMTVTFAVQIIEEINRNDSTIKVFEWVKTTEGNLEKIFDYKGKEFPDYKFETLENESLRISDLKGKPIFVDLWFTSCRPCIAKFPELNTIAKKYKDEVHFVAITFNTSKEVEKLLKKHPLDFIHVVDAKPFLKEIGQQLYPKNVLLDKSGRVVFISDSFTPLEKKEMQDVIEEILGSK
ncbi:Thiol-disulfide isomerase or thioredoxin [Marivirga sericea]|uniref:Thiol-disulfide isomerase or thioredoxin n=1 Tax=Marivirga sericea TaxID=1028 RepID=A0A1X7IYM7_9BACT|nr:TlpA disulfide reductase family protein [Marivirga sericea]SMG20407.1 Thiol-disulfide isomerase or thioredoxin [Marivirga sericea]